VGTIKEPITCPKGCNEVYCCRGCVDNAASSYHSVLCPGGAGPDHPIRKYMEYADKTTYRFQLAARILVMTISALKAQQPNPFERFARGPWAKISHYDSLSKVFEHDDAKAQGVDFSVMKENLLEASLETLKLTPIYDAHYDYLFTFDNWNHLIGLIDMNGGNVESLPDSETRTELCKLLKCKEDEVPHSAGTGLFAIHSSLNHSCRPNAEVVGGLRHVKDAQIQVVALKSIKKGDEITISYIDDLKHRDREDRHKELNGGYLFECACNRCEQEKQ